MDFLSTEIISLILDNLQDDSLAQYAAVSRQWQREIERRTFATLNITNDDLRPFSANLGKLNKRRRSYVRSLSYEVRMPCKGDSKAEHLRNQETIRNSIISLLKALATWDNEISVEDQEVPGRESASGSLHLLLRFGWKTDSATDATTAPAITLRYFTLSDEDFQQIPAAISRVTALTISVMPGRAVHPDTSCRLAARLPHLEAFELSYWDPPVYRRDLRALQRCAVAKNLMMILEKKTLPLLEELSLRREGAGAPGNYNFNCQDFTEGRENGSDVLCEAIRSFVSERSIHTLRLYDVLLSVDMFRDPRPGEQEDVSTGLSAELPCWSTLRSLSIRSSLVRADGAWLFTGRRQDVREWYINPSDDAIIFCGTCDSDSSDDGASDSESDDGRDYGYAYINGEGPQHYWRTKPDHETFDPLALSLARAALRMPKLESLSFSVMRVKAEDGIIVTYDGAGHQRRVSLEVGNATEWAAPEKLLSAWKQWAGGGMVICNGIEMEPLV